MRGWLCYSGGASLRGYVNGDELGNRSEFDGERRQIGMKIDQS
jgi:hypothetical protein